MVEAASDRAFSKSKVKKIEQQNFIKTNIKWFPLGGRPKKPKNIET